VNCALYTGSHWILMFIELLAIVLYSLWVSLTISVVHLFVWIRGTVRVTNCTLQISNGYLSRVSSSTILVAREGIDRVYYCTL
jgi:hypothetical protein